MRNPSLFPAKLYTVQARSVSVSLEQITPELVRDWLTLHGDRRHADILRHGEDAASILLRDRLYEAADAVAKNWALKA